MKDQKSLFIALISLLLVCFASLSWGQIHYQAKPDSYYANKLANLNKQIANQQKAQQTKNKKTMQQLQSITKRADQIKLGQQSNQQQKPLKKCDCYDQSVEANTQADNFHYNNQGKRVKRIKPACRCQSATKNQSASNKQANESGSNNISVSSNTSSNSSANTDQSSDHSSSGGATLPDFNIQY